MKNIYKLKFHPLFSLLTIICIITGNFKNFFLFMLVILLHELGHILMGIILKQKIEKVIILPFGGITIFNMFLNIEKYKEFLIAISGPIMQIISFIILKNIINNYNFYYYNLVILIFNLIPIYPLDGSKILNVICNCFLSYNYSFHIMIIVSLIFISISIFILINLKINLLLIIIFIFLIIKTIQELLNYKNIYNKFLFERYYYNFNFPKIKYIKNIKDFYKDRRHLIYNNKIYQTEKDILRKRFDFQRNI